MCFYCFTCPVLGKFAGAGRWGGRKLHSGQWSGSGSVVLPGTHVMRMRDISCQLHRCGTNILHSLRPILLLPYISVSDETVFLSLKCRFQKFIQGSDAGQDKESFVLRNRLQAERMQFVHSELFQIKLRNRANNFFIQSGEPQIAGLLNTRHCICFLSFRWAIP